jgi:FkbM family methyltransferase
MPGGMMDRRTIYDVGVHDGKDSAYYLARGFRVIGVEASPVMAAHLQSRFASEIQQGEFVLVNVAIAETEGEAEFWISEHSEWSSFNRDMASRDGRGCTPVTVKTRPFGSIIEEYGVPYFCKIDIEGFDSVCLRSLNRRTAPEYISVEMSLKGPTGDLHLLKNLGYSKFKIVSQMTRSQPSPWLTRIQCAVPWRVAAALREADTRLRGVTSVGEWRFEFSSSGPFGEDTPGRWRSYDAILGHYQALEHVEVRRERRGLHDWFDIHATQ